MWGEIKVAVGENRVRNICSFFFVQSEKRKGIFHFSEYNFFFFFFFFIILLGMGCPGRCRPYGTGLG
jgi:hypothetical protein